MNPAGIASVVAIVLGIVLLVAYAMRRGLVQRELDGTDEEAAALAADDPTAVRAPRPATRANAGRPLAILGAVLLLGGALGAVMTATGGGASSSSTPAGAQGGQDCAAGWEGCPKDTPKP